MCSTSWWRPPDLFTWKPKTGKPTQLDTKVGYSIPAYSSHYTSPFPPMTSRLRLFWPYCVEGGSNEMWQLRLTLITQCKNSKIRQIVAELKCEEWFLQWQHSSFGVDTGIDDWVMTPPALYVSPVSHLYGFGLVDADAMVVEAKKWRSVPPQHTCTKISDRRTRWDLAFAHVPFSFSFFFHCRHPSVCSKPWTLNDFTAWLMNAG